VSDAASLFYGSVILIAMRNVPREWKTYQYVEPRKILIGLRENERRYAGKGLDEMTLRLRTRELRPYHEKRQALLFAYGMECGLGITVSVAFVEREDYDCIQTFQWQGERQFVPVQIKELPPADLNDKADLQAEISKLTKYSSSNDLVVAFHLNRNVRVAFDELQIPPLKLRELWFFFATSPAQGTWLMYGNALGRPRSWTYEYPA
jgi:hypothetical protein